MSRISDLIEMRFGIGAEIGGAAPAEGALAAMLGRATRRRFRDRPVADGLLKVLLACAQSAPTKSDLQQYSIVVVKDPAARRTLSELCGGGPQLEQAAVLLVFSADMARNRKITEMRGYAFANNNLDAFLNATVDAALAMQSFIVAAEAVGLGCCPLSVVRNRIAEVSETLALPPGVFPISGLAVGWPAGVATVSMRLPPSVVVHWDRYEDGNLEAEVAAYDERRHGRQPIPPARQRHADRYGVAQFCGWSENAARQLAVAERADFRAFLMRHGFDLA